VAILGTIIFLAGYTAISRVIGLVIPDKDISLALSILPYAFLAVWLMSIISIFQASLDGFQRSDIRSVILIGDGILNLILCFLLIPRYGLMGAAYARVFDNFAIMIVSWVFVRKQNSLMPFFPSSWDKKIFKEIFVYGCNFQIITLTAILYDPITKGLLAKFGGISAVGYYEMANKLILQFRALIVSINQVLIPAFANLKEIGPQKVYQVYLISYRLIFYLSVPLFALIMVSLPLICQLWIGRHEPNFILFGGLLIIGWLFNIFNVPAYFAFLGVGDLRWNLISHIFISILNISLGALWGYLYDGIGVVMAWMFSLSLGSSVVYISFHFKLNIPFMELLPKASRKIFIICSLGILSTFLTPFPFPLIPVSISVRVISPLLLCLLLLPLIWGHPMRKSIVGWVWEAVEKQ
jgi:O-antigen/teichoic acid export membrane protein